MDALSRAYFRKFIVRVEVLPEYQKRASYSDVIREGQEALELFLKALLRCLGADPSFTHDPGKELRHYVDRVPSAFSSLARELVSWSRNLRRERELSFYGAADFIPTEEYSKEDGEKLIEFLERVSKALRGWPDYPAK